MFEFFDKDGGGTIDYGELLLKFSRREEMDILKAGHKKGKKYKPGFSNHRVNLERVKRRRAREINKKQMLEDKKRQRSARIRQNLRQAFEDRLANRINLGIREQRISIKDRQDNLVLTHQSQMKRKAKNEGRERGKKEEGNTIATIVSRLMLFFFVCSLCSLLLFLFLQNVLAHRYQT